ncbi:MAG: 5-aminovalerate aminotransferase DavT [Actinomycetota bacterium]
MTESPLKHPADNATVREADTSNVFHSWSAQGTLAPFVIAGGKGARVWDYEGNTYLDFHPCWSMSTLATNTLR